MAACTVDPVPIDTSAFSPPAKSVAIPRGSISVDVEPGENLPVEQTAFRKGITEYFAKHLPSWSTVPPTTQSALSLICDADVRGITNCDDVAYSCVVKHSTKTVDEFEKVLESQMCGRPTMNAREVQAFNHAQELGSSVVEALAEYEDLELAVAEQELFEARNAPGTKALAALVERYPDTRIAEQAKTEIAERNKPKKAPPLSTKVANNTNQPSKSASRSSSTSLSCYDARNAICGDYSFPTVAERDNFARQCRSLGSRVLSEKCDTTGAFGCAFSAPNGNKTVTWVFNLSRAQVQASCPTPVING